MDRGVAVGRVEDVPLPAGCLDEEREPGVAHLAGERHLPQRLGVVEPVALGIVRAPGDERLDEVRQVDRVHLVIGVHLDADVHPLAQGVAIPGHHGRAHALVAFMDQEAHPRVVDRARPRARMTRFGARP